MVLANSQTALLVIEKKGRKIFRLVHFDVWFFCCHFSSDYLLVLPLLLLLFSFGVLWQRNVYRLCVYMCTTLVCSSSSSECTTRKTKCKICEYLHNWMIWYSIRQFECLSSLWCVGKERPSSNNDHFLAHTFSIHTSYLLSPNLSHFKNIFFFACNSETSEWDGESESDVMKYKWFVWQNASTATEHQLLLCSNSTKMITDSKSFDRKQKKQNIYVIFDF